MIYILDNDPHMTAIMLTDKSLDRMIKDIDQILGGVHHTLPRKNGSSCYCSIKYNDSFRKNQWVTWARECLANYKYLLRLLLQCLQEIDHRFLKLNLKYSEIYCWARDNVPDLPERIIDGEIVSLRYPTPFPLVMPKKYQLGTTEISETNQSINDSHNRWAILSYRNYYQAKLKQRIRHGMPNDWHDHAEDSEHVGCTHTIKWTRRDKPEWLKL